MTDIENIRKHYHDVKDFKRFELIKQKDVAEAKYESWIDGCNFIMDILEKYEKPCDNCNSKQIKKDGEVNG